MQALIREISAAEPGDPPPKNLRAPSFVCAILERASSAHELHRRRRWWRQRRRSRYPTLNRGIARRAGWRRGMATAEGGRESRSLIIRIPRAPRWTYGDDRITPSARP